MIKIAIASGKGGTGKTLIATNIFNTLIINHKEATLVDCDAEAPNAAVFFSTRKKDTFDVHQMVPVINTDKCTYCGKCHDYCVYNAIFLLPPTKVIKVIEDLCHGCGACSYACKDGAITEKAVSLGQVNSYLTNSGYKIIEAKMNIGVMSPVPVIKASINHADKEGIIIMDSPPGTSCPFIQTASKADYIVLVTEPTPFGLSDLKQSVYTLQNMDKPFGVIINRTGLGNRDVYKWLEEENIDLIMELPFNESIAKTYSEGKLITDELPDYKTVFFDLTNKINDVIKS